MVGWSQTHIAGELLTYNFPCFTLSRAGQQVGTTKPAIVLLWGANAHKGPINYFWPISKSKNIGIKEKDIYMPQFVTHVSKHRHSFYSFRAFVFREWPVYFWAAADSELTSSDPLLDEAGCGCCGCCGCFLSIADLWTARMLGLDFQNCTRNTNQGELKGSETYSSNIYTPKLNYLPHPLYKCSVPAKQWKKTEGFKWIWEMYGMLILYIMLLVLQMLFSKTKW